MPSKQYADNYMSPHGLHNIHMRRVSNFELPRRLAVATEYRRLMFDRYGDIPDKVRDKLGIPILVEMLSRVSNHAYRNRQYKNRKKKEKVA